MTFDVPSDYRYLETHEWAAIEGDHARIGITDFAQDELGDIVFVELPDVGDGVAAGERFGTVESIKAVSDIYAPVSGTVTEVNELLFDQPELVNQEPFEDGWMIRVELDDGDAEEATLSAATYREQIE